MIAVQMPDGASLERTESRDERDHARRPRRPGRGTRDRIGTGGPSPLDGDVSLANAGIVYLMLKNWSERGHGEDLEGDQASLASRGARRRAGGAHARARPAADPGPRRLERLPDAGRDDRRQLRLRAAPARDRRHRARGQRLAGACASAFTAFRASVPQVTVDVDKTHAATLNVAVGDVYNTVQIYLGSSFVNLFTRYGHNYMVYLQADPHAPSERPGRQGPLRAQPGRKHGAGRGRGRHPRGARDRRSCRSTTCFPRRRSTAWPRAGWSSGQALAAMEADRPQDAAARDGFRVDGDVVPGAARRELHLLHLRARDPARLLRALRPVRELDHAGRGHSRGADGAPRNGRGAQAGRATTTTSTSRSGSCC